VENMKKSQLLLVGWVVVGLVILGNVNAESANTKTPDEVITAKDIDSLSDSMADDALSKCSVTDDQIIAQGVKPEDISKVRDFCKLSKKEMKKTFGDRLKKTNDKNLNSVFMGYTNSYLCYYIGLNTVPNYADLGLTSSTCSWHDSSPSSCKVEGKVACLWGCTNNDPKIGWHKRVFTNLAAFESVIYSKGYHKVPAYACYGAQNDYARAISNGYRYEMVANTLKDGTVEGHVEGPEADPETNWYGIVNGFYPEEVFLWHKTC
jgi:hypothetical protein